MNLDAYRLAVKHGRDLYSNLCYKAPEQLRQMGIQGDDDLLTVAIRAAVAKYAESTDERGDGDGN